MMKIRTHTIIMTGMISVIGGYALDTYLVLEKPFNQLGIGWAIAGLIIAVYGVAKTYWNHYKFSRGSEKMSDIYEQFTKKEKLVWAKSELNYEKASGQHTYTLCKCGRRGYRNRMCILCWREEITKLRSKMEVKK